MYAIAFTILLCPSNKQHITFLKVQDPDKTPNSSKQVGQLLNGNAVSVAIPNIQQYYTYQNLKTKTIDV